jgi:PAS domain S-box-containing protein
MTQALRILIVEDTVADADLLRRSLLRGGYEPITYEVVDTKAGMRAALEAHEWDVITCDNSMPGFSAGGALALVKEMRLEIPLIIVSGEIDLDLAVTLMRGGAEDYVPKKELPRLTAAIDHVLREASLRSARVRDMAALLASEARYRRLFETAHDGILIIDADSGLITDVNPFLENLLGHSKAEFLGKRLWDIGPFRDSEASKAAFGELQISGYIRYEDLPLETTGGKRIDVEFVSNVYLVDGQRVIQCNIRDITERKRTEVALRMLTAELEDRVKERTVELETLNRELDAFSYSVSHDLRAPLRQVDSYAQILEEDHAANIGTDGVEAVHKIRATVTRMGALIEALLKLARLSIDKVSREAVDLTAMGKLVAAELGQSEPARHVEWRIAEGVTVNSDPQLTRILMDNLLGNAWKFTARRNPAHIEFGVTPPQADGTVTYFVRDDGAGFDPAYSDKLFGAFQRLHPVVEFPGIGVGLATVQRIVRRHDGRVSGDGEVDHGATFRFTLGNGQARLNGGSSGHSPADSFSGLGQRSTARP